jgi:uncharacterized protein YjbI with pentapeptide repeats
VGRSREEVISNTHDLSDVLGQEANFTCSNIVSAKFKRAYLVDSDFFNSLTDTNVEDANLRGVPGSQRLSPMET